MWVGFFREKCLSSRTQAVLILKSVPFLGLFPGQQGWGNGWLCGVLNHMAFSGYSSLPCSSTGPALSCNASTKSSHKKGSFKRGNNPKVNITYQTSVLSNPSSVGGWIQARRGSRMVGVGKVWRMLPVGNVDSQVGHWNGGAGQSGKGWKAAVAFQEPSLPSIPTFPLQR